MVMNPAGLGPENDCAGEDQQHLQTTDPFSLTSDIKTISASVQLENKITGRESQGLVARMNCLAIKRQS
jgi:hypothetical protein